MKKIFIVLVLCITVFVSSSMTSTNVSALTEVVDYKLKDSYLYLNEFVTANPSRVAFSQGETDASVWIANKFKSLNLTTTIQTFTVEGNVNKSQNVIAEYKSPNASKGRVIIGAHYDNAELGMGAYDNGSGVATMLAVAKNISSVKDYDVTFVAFGAEEVGLIGSTLYVATLNSAKNILMFINIDTIAAGEVLYVYGEDVPTVHEDYFVKQAQKSGIDTLIKNMPAYKFSIPFIDGYPSYMPYYHTGQASDHSSFKVLKIPTIFFFAGNLEGKYYGFAENSDLSKQVMHTKNDTVAKLDEIYGNEHIKRMEAVRYSIEESLKSSELLNVATTGKTQLVDADIWFNYLIAKGILLGILLICGGFCYLYHRKLLKLSIINTSVIKKRSAFEKPESTDIFTFRK